MPRPPWALFLTMFIPLWPPCTHPLMATSSWIMHQARIISNWFLEHDNEFTVLKWPPFGCDQVYPKPIITKQTHNIRCRWANQHMVLKKHANVYGDQAICDTINIISLCLVLSVNFLFHIWSKLKACKIKCNTFLCMCLKALTLELC